MQHSRVFLRILSSRTTRWSAFFKKFDRFEMSFDTEEAKSFISPLLFSGGACLSRGTSSLLEESFWFLLWGGWYNFIVRKGDRYFDPLWTKVFCWHSYATTKWIKISTPSYYGLWIYNWPQNWSKTHKVRTTGWRNFSLLTKNSEKFGSQEKMTSSHGQFCSLYEKL